jgi:Spy/CpxP family protein refolding chaperone
MFNINRNDMKTKIELNAIKMVVLVAIMLLGNAVKAQDHQRPMPQQRIPDSTQVVKMVNRMAKKLNLTDEQKQKFVDFHLEHFKQVKAKQQEMNGNREQNRKEMESLRLELDKKLKSVLTDEQKVEFDKLKKNRRSRPEMRQRPNRPARMN